MLAQDLKDYINRTLGSSLKCLLPSYWWKKMFGLIIDKTEEDKEITDSKIADLRKIAEAYKERCFYLAEEDADDYKEYNAQIFGKVVASSIGYRPTMPIYFLTGDSRRDSNYICSSNYTVGFKTVLVGESYTMQYFIRVRDVAFDRLGFAEVEIYEDGSYVINPNFQLHYRTDGQSLSDEEMKYNYNVLRPFYLHGGDVSFLSRIHCYVNGVEVKYPVVGIINNSKFRVLEDDGVAEIDVTSSTGAATYEKVFSFDFTFTLPLGVANLTPDNNVYTFSESEALAWQNAPSNARIIVPYKRDGTTFYKECEPNGKGVEFITYDSATSQLTYKRVLYSINSDGVTANFKTTAIIPTTSV